MVDKFRLIKQLRPIALKFDPYDDKEISIDMAPKLWSDHRYTTEKGYHYSVAVQANDSITISIENVCPKNCINFKPHTLPLNGFIELLQKAYNENINFFSIPIEITYSLTKCDNCLRENRACKMLSDDKPNSLYLKLYFSKKDIGEALDYYINYESYDEPKNDRTVVALSEPAVSSYSNPKPNENVKKENCAMENALTNNLFGTQWGPINDPNISATALGICFRSKTGNWIKFNPKTRERVDLGNLQFGNFGLFLIPSRTLDVGTPILYENEYYYVMDTDEWPKLTLLSVADGIEKTVYPATNILGINFFAKVVALIDTDTLMGGDSDDLFTVLALTGNLGGNGNTNIMGTDSSIYNLIWLSALQGDGEGGLLSGLTDGGLLSGLGGDNGNSIQKYLPLLIATGAFGNTQSMDGTNMNPLLLMLALKDKKNTPATKAKKTTKAKSKTKAAKETESLTEERIMEMIQSALKPTVEETEEEAEPLTEEKVKKMIEAATKPASKAPAKKPAPKKKAAPKTQAKKTVEEPVVEEPAAETKN